MKNLKVVIQIDVDMERKDTVLVYKPEDVALPKDKAQLVELMCEDIEAVTIALISIVRLLERQKPELGPRAMKWVMEALQEGYVDPDSTGRIDFKIEG